MTTSACGGGDGASGGGREASRKGFGRSASAARPRSTGERAGDRERARFEALHSAYRTIVESRCRRLLTTQAAAEDAAQEVFVKIMTHLSDVPDGESTLPWIRRVTTNHCLNELRKEKRRCATVEPLRDAVCPPGADVAERDLAVRVLAHVSPQVRTIAWLKHVDEVDQQQIAERLGISRRTVVSRLSTFNDRARKLLARLESSQSDRATIERERRRAHPARRTKG